MPVEVNFPSKKVTLEIVVDLLKMFCECYELKYYDTDARRLKINYKDFQESGTLEYRLALGIKFIIYKSGEDQIKVWPNLADYVEPPQKSEECFNKLVLDYFSKKDK